MWLIKIYLYFIVLIRLLKGYKTEIVPNDFLEIDVDNDETYIYTNIIECIKVCFKQIKENVISDMLLKKDNFLFLNKYIKVLAFFNCIKGKNTEIHFRDCKSNEITNKYIYTNIYKVFFSYYSTMLCEIECKIEEL